MIRTIFSLVQARTVAVCACVSSHWASVARDPLLQRKCALEHAWQCSGAKSTVNDESHPSSAYTLAKHGDLVAVGGYSCWKLWSLSDSMTLTGVCYEHDMLFVYSLCFCGDMLLTGDYIGKLCGWNTNTGEMMFSVRAHERCVWAIQDLGQFVATGGGDGRIQTLRKGVWALEQQYFEGHEKSVLCLSHHQDRQLLVSGSRDCNLCVWDMKDGKCVGTLTGHLSHIRCIDIQEDIIVSGSCDAAVRLWSITTLECLRIFEGHASWVNIVMINSGKLISGSGCTLRVWGVDDFLLLRTLNIDNQIVGLWFDMSKLIVLDSKWNIHSWDFSQGLCEVHS